MKTIRAAVIGVGSMGRHHARVYAQMPGVELIGVSDHSREVGERVAQEFQTGYYTDYLDLLRHQPDVVSVVVPTEKHVKVGKAALELVPIVLIEKPIALNTHGADMLIKAAAETGHRLTIGHIERYNPAVVATKAILESGQIGRPLMISFRREGPDPTRIRDVNIIDDIGIHDIDLALHFMGCKPERLSAVAGNLKRELEDYAHITFTFRPDGERTPTIVKLDLSWVNTAKIRRIYVNGSNGYLVSDLISQEVHVYPPDTAPIFRSFENYEVWRDHFLDQKTEQIPVEKGEPLIAELTEVVKAARGEPARLVDPIEARNALRYAQHATSEARLGNGL